MSGDQQQGKDIPDDDAGHPEASADHATASTTERVTRRRTTRARVRIPAFDRDLRRLTEQARRFQRLTEPVMKVQRLVEQTRQFQRPFEQVNKYLDSLTHWQQSIRLPILDYTRTLRFSHVDFPLQRLADQVAEVFARLPRLEDIQRRVLTREGPDNWADLRDTHDLLGLLVIAEEGIPVTWVPRSTVLAELIDAEPSWHHRILLSHQDDVLDDCDRLLAQADDGMGAEQARLLEQTTQVLRRGQFAPAQALAANVIDTVLRTAVLAPTFGYYKKVKAEIDDAPLHMLPWAVTHWPILTALQQFNGSSDEPTPDYFNRHASAHQADLTQYTPTNALIAVMLATSALTEARRFRAKTATDSESPQHSD